MKTTRPDQTLREQLDNYLAVHHKRRTVERYAILDKVAGTRGRFRAEDIATAMSEGPLTVSVPTVYSALDLMVDCGILRRFNLGHQVSYYELTTSTGGVHHIHLVCRSCGRIKQVRDADLNESISARHYSAFVPDDYSLNIYGYCTRCARRHASQANKKNKTINKPINDIPHKRHES